jgi:hypothetical protein
MLLGIAGAFIVTLIYGAGLRNHTFGTMLMYAAIIYPAVILFSLSAYVPKLNLNYYQLNPEGVRITIFGFIHKHIYWSDIERIGTTNIMNFEGLGLLYKPSRSRHVFGAKPRRIMFGWDEMLADARRADGASFIEDAVKQAKQYAGQANG